MAAARKVQKARTVPIDHRLPHSLVRSPSGNHMQAPDGTQISIPRPRVAARNNHVRKGPAREWVPLPHSLLCKIFGFSGRRRTQICACVCLEFDSIVKTEPICYPSTYFEFKDSANCPFDNEGVLYWIGTSGGTEEYINPSMRCLGDSNEVQVILSSQGTTKSNGKHFVQHRTPEGQFTNKYNNTTSSQENSYMSVNLSSASNRRQVIPHHYCLRHGFTGHYVLRNWELQGSVDGAEWITLKRHKDDSTLTSNFGEGAWSIPNPHGQAFGHFRIFSFGKNSQNSDTLCCSGIELFGEMFEDEQ